jgi:perosamine synthetase
MMDGTTPSHIPWARPILYGQEADYARDAVLSTYWSTGPYLDRLERAFAERHEDAGAVLACANGTATLHLALLTYGIGPGDEVILPGWAFAAAANMVLMTGATPVFVDVDPATWVMTPAAVRAALTPRTRVIVPVHTFGVVCDMPGIMAAVAGTRVRVIEDCAESLGSRVAGRICGVFGHMASWSLQSTKTVACGEGGLLLVQDKDALDQARLVRSHGMRAEPKYMHVVVGHNFRLTNIQAAVACAQLEAFDRIATMRRQVYAAYVERLRELPVRLQAIPADVDPIMWALGLLPLPDVRRSRAEIMAAMAARGVETRPGFGSFSVQPMFRAPPMPVSDRLGAELLSVPFPADLSEAEMERIVSALRAAFG